MHLLRGVGSSRLFQLGLATALVVAAVDIYRPALLSRLDYRVYDQMIRRGVIEPPDGRVVIVDVDDRSLSAVGQWPWPRDAVARLVAAIRDAGPAAIALDVLFSEPDRSATRDVLDVRDGGSAAGDDAITATDASLSATLTAGRFVVGYAFTFQTPNRPPERCVLHPLSVAVVHPPGDAADSPLFRATDAVCSLPAIARAAGASGFLNAAPDADGVLRRVPMLIQYGDRIYPSLPLALAMVATNTRQATLQIRNANTASLLLDDHAVPLDGKGNLLLRYRGRKRVFPHVSAGDVISRRVGADAFANKVVVIGATALGTREVVTTPLDTLFTGVEVQATAADNLLRRDFVYRPEFATAFEALATFGLCVVIAFMFVRVGPLWGGLATICALIAAWVGARSMLTATGAFLSPVIPILGTIVESGVLVVAAYVGEHRRADRAADDRGVARRLMIQSLVSLAEIRDADTGRHSRRTQLYARRLAEALSHHVRFGAYLTPDRIDLLASLAPLHDIGKVGIPDRLLNKPGLLTHDELEEMRKHPAYGRDVIIKAEQRVGVHDDEVLAMAKDIVYTHHEWWNGHGYPSGLQGDLIPIPGRVVTLVDVYDALTTRRVYRQALLHERAVDVIVAGRGTHFDPAVVDAFLAVSRDFERIAGENAAAQMGVARPSAVKSPARRKV